MIKAGFSKGLVLCYALAGLVAASHPARALDDGKGNGILDVLDLLGLGEKKEEAVIQYRERAPLVLPPKTELRQPMPPAAERAANWPQDQEELRAARRAEANRIRAEDAESDNPRYAGKLTRIGRINAADMKQKPGATEPCSMVPDALNRCDPTTLWKNLSVKSDDKAEKGLQAGVEPDRQYLTQPPKGYMAPTKNVKPTFEPRHIEEGSVFDYYHQAPKSE